MNKFAMGCGVLLAILLFIVVIAALALGGSYNRLVRLQQTVDQSWAQVQNVYQRRADLIPNLVNTVTGAANFEKTTLTEVVDARASVGKVQLPAGAAFRDLQAQLEGTENRISVERGRFNEAVQAYNTAIKRFPAALFAGMFGFREKPYFTATAGSET